MEPCPDPAPRRRRWWGDGLGFGASVLVLAGAQFFTFPLLIAALGAQQWAGLNVGTTIGTIAALVGGWGWPLTGAATVATMTLAQRADFWWTSVRVRTPLTALALAAMTCVVLLVPTSSHGATWLAAAASLTTLALVPGWFHVGEAAPERLFRNLTLPSLAGILVGTTLATLSGDARLHALSNLCAAGVALVLTHRDISRRHRHLVSDLPARTLRTELRRQRSSVGVGLLSAVNMGAPVLAVAVWFPAALPAYTLGERLFRMAQTLTAPVTQVLHGRIPTTAREQTLRRLGRIVLPLVGVALAAGAGFALVVPTASTLYTQGHITVDPTVAVAFGLALSASLVSATVGVVGLALSGRTRGFVGSTALGVVVTLTLLSVTVMSGAGAWGAACAVAAAETVIVVVQARMLRRILR